MKIIPSPRRLWLAASNRNRQSPSSLKCVWTCLLVLAGLAGASGADGSWNVDADGTWSVPANWLNSIVASGPGSTAWFTNGLAAVRTITLDSTRTNGNLVFDDSNAAVQSAGWILSGSGLTLSNSAAVPIITVNPINALTGTVDVTNDVVVNAVLSSPQGFVKNGQGTLTLNGANSFGANPQLNAGIVALGNASALGSGNRPVTFNGGGVRVWNAGPTYANTNNLVTSGIIVSSNGNYDAFNGPWLGSGTMLIHSTSRLTPGGGSASAFAGFTGTIDLTDSTGNETRINLGSGSTPYDLSRITLNSGTNAGRFDFRPTTAPCRVLIGALLGGPNTRLQSSENAGGTSLYWEIGYLNTSTTFQGTIANHNSIVTEVGHLVKVGTGTLTLTGTSPYTGVTTISNGVLALTGTAALTGATNYITVLSPGVFDVSGLNNPFGLSATQTLGGNGVVTGSVALVSGRLAPGTATTGTLSFSNSLSLDGTTGVTTNLFKLGSGINDQIRVAGDLAFNGIVALRVVPTGAAIPNGNYVLYQWAGALTGDTNNLALEYPAQLGTFLLSTNLVTKQLILQVSGVPSANNLTWRGDGGANAWDFSTLNWINGATASLFNNGDKATFDDTGSNNVPVDISFGNVSPSAVIVNATRPYTLASSAAAGITGAISLLKSNTGVLTITADNSYSGGTLVAGGVLQVGDGASGSGSLGSGTITNNAVLVYNRPDPVTVGPVIAGSGSVVERGAGGTLVLNGANTYSGGTIISNGTLQLTAYSALSSGPVTLAGGTLEIVPSGGPATGLSNSVNATADSTLRYDGTGTYGAVVFGPLSGNPGTTITIDHTAAGPDRLRLYANFTNNANLNLDAAGIALAPYAGSDVQVYNGVISGPGQIVNRASGAITHLNAENTYSGGTRITTGTLALGTNSVSSAGAVVSGPLGTGPLYLAPEPPNTGGTGTIEASGAARTVENPIQYPSNTFSLIIGGSNMLTLSGPFTLLGNDGSGNTNRVIQVNNTNTPTVLSGVLSDTNDTYTTSLICGLIKTGSGTLVLANTNTYTGPTIVGGGVLFANGQLDIGGVTVTNGELGGSGTILGPVDVQAGGGLTNGGGTLTVLNNLDLEASASANFLLGTVTPQIVVASNLVLNAAATINLSAGAGFADGTYTLFTYGQSLAWGPPVLGATPSGHTCALNTNTAGQVRLVVQALPANTRPVFTAPPSGTNILVNAGVTLLVTNTAADSDVPAQTLTYSLLSGPGNASLNVANGVLTWRPLVSQATSNFPVNVVVTDNGTPNLSATNTYSLTVNPLPRPSGSAPSYSGGQFSLTVNGPFGPDYTVQSSTNLTTTNWVTVFATNSPVPPFRWTDPGSTNRAGFYRILLGP